ncbi:MAG: DNRLRE domain-containing protein [Rhodothermales bacterium]
MNRLLHIVLAALILGSASARAQTAVIPAAEDTWIDAVAPTVDNSAQSILEADGDPLAVTLLRWDLTSIPSPAFVLDARIRVRLTNGSVDAFHLYGLPEPWDAAEPTDASRRGIVPLGVLTAPSSGTHFIELTDAGLQVVQFWLDRPEKNFGLVLAPAGQGTDGIELASSEAASADIRPALELEYVTSQVTFENRPPDGLVTVDRPSGSAPLTVRFDATASVDPEGGSVTAEWTFPDGTTATGATTSYVFSAPGAAEVTVRLTDALGATTVLSLPVDVREPNTVTGALVNGVNGYDGMTDTKIKADAPTTAHGADPNLEVDGDPDYATLLRWDLTGIPAGVTITGAAMDVQISNTSGDAYPVYALLRPWNEMQATWEVAAEGVPWAVPGAQGPTDRSAVVVAEYRPTTTGPRSLTFNEDGVALFQQWVDHPETNFGVIAQEFDRAADGVDFFSSDHPDIAVRPVLRLSWVVPEPPPALGPPPLGLLAVPGNAPGAWSFTATTSPDAAVTWMIGDETQAGLGASATFDGAGVHVVRATASRPDGGLSVASTSIRLEAGRWPPVDLGIQKPLGVDILSVYPNPSRTLGTARVALPSDDTVELSLHDVLGRRVWSGVFTTGPEDIREVALPVDRLARGTYVLFAQSRGGKGTDSHVMAVQ